MPEALGGRRRRFWLEWVSFSRWILCVFAGRIPGAWWLMWFRLLHVILQEAGARKQAPKLVDPFGEIRRPRPALFYLFRLIGRAKRLFRQWFETLSANTLFISQKFMCVPSSLPFCAYLMDVRFLRVSFFFSFSFFCYVLDALAKQITGGTRVKNAVL